MYILARVNLLYTVCYEIPCSSKAKVFYAFCQIRSFQLSTYLKNEEVSVCCGFYNPRNQTETHYSGKWTQPTWPKLTQIFDTQGQSNPTWPKFWPWVPNLTRKLDQFKIKKFGLYNSNIYDLEGQNEMILLLIWWIGNKI